MKDDNKGFTLVELIISIVIFGIVVAAVFGFMLAGSRSYSAITNRLNQDVQSQLTMNQLESYIIDCNSCLYFQDNRLYIINENSDETYTANLFEFKSDGCIYYGNKQIPKDSFTDPIKAADILSLNIKTDDLLTEDVTSFSVVPISSNGVSVTSAVVTIGFKRNSQTYTGEKTVALRNKPAIAKSSITG